MNPARPPMVMGMIHVGVIKKGSRSGALVTRRPGDIDTFLYKMVASRNDIKRADSIRKHIMFF